MIIYKSQDFHAGNPDSNSGGDATTHHNYFPFLKPQPSKLDNSSRRLTRRLYPLNQRQNKQIVFIKIVYKRKQCWVPTNLKKDPGGYNFNGLHREIYSTAYGPIPQGMVIRHLCHNPSCINPDHLAMGTHLDNVQDRVNAKRSAIGNKNGRAKLTPRKVSEIRKRRNDKISVLAKEFNVSERAISFVLSGKNWAHIKENNPCLF